VLGGVKVEGQRFNQQNFKSNDCDVSFETDASEGYSGSYWDFGCNNISSTKRRANPVMFALLYEN
jgi:hypothetical protein